MKIIKLIVEKFRGWEENNRFGENMGLAVFHLYLSHPQIATLHRSKSTYAVIVPTHDWKCN